MRQLASIQKVVSIDPIPDADAIERCGILGWGSVIKKEQNIKVDDLVVFIEVDSVLDFTRPLFALMEKNNGRVKTVKLKKTLSQGLVFKISDFPELSVDLTEGTDVTGLLKITKYDPPEFGFGGTKCNARGNFPVDVIKTDETRIQSIPAIIEELKDIPCYVSVKMDGSSFTAANIAGDVHVCSRNQSAKDEEGNKFWAMAKKYNIPDQLLAETTKYAIQGELCGPGVQDNRLGLKENDLFVFNVFNIDDRKYLGFDEFIAFCAKFGLKTVPIEHTEFLLNDHTVDSLLKLAEGTYPGTQHPREGIVIRPKIEQHSHRLHGRASFKAINNEFLLKIKA